MSASKILLFCCLSFIGGVFLSSFLKLPQPSFFLFFILFSFLVVFYKKRKKAVIILLCLILFLGGIWQEQNAEIKIKNDELRGLNDYQKPITLLGMVAEEPDIRETIVRLIIKTEKVFLGNALLDITNFQGKVLIITPKYPEYQYGDKLKITGKLQTPQDFGEFSYKNYLAKDGIYSTMFYPQIQLAAKNQGNFVYAQILSLKSRLRENIYNFLLPPQSSILGAIILGDKSQISQNWKEKLNIAGVRHITAISGMHVAILINILMVFFIGLGFWRNQAFYLTLIFIALFVILTGCQVSTIRAAIMGGLLLLSQKTGRMSYNIRNVVFAATIMLAVNPLLLRYDIGFQLSFLAVLGIIYLAPVFEKILQIIPQAAFLNLRGILSMTLSAQIFTLPILVYNFGYISKVAPITNVLIVPLLPFIMVSGFIFGLLGMFSQILGWLASIVSWALLTYLTVVVDFFARFSFSVQTLQVSWTWLLTFYLILGIIVFRLNKRFNKLFFK